MANRTGVSIAAAPVQREENAKKRLDEMMVRAAEIEDGRTSTNVDLANAPPAIRPTITARKLSKQKEFTKTVNASAERTTERQQSARRSKSTDRVKERLKAVATLGQFCKNPEDWTEADLRMLEQRLDRYDALVPRSRAGFGT
ncbi:unnamed protein product, partial [Amoebophrya sp. A25]|eukprot:GSA25T00007827001.1